MTSSSRIAEHQDHVRWQNESAMWRDDLQEWRKEHELALLALNNALTCHNNALSEHLRAIALHEAKVLDAEHRMAEFENAPPLVAGETTCQLGEPHQEHAVKQNQLRDAHERIKRHHYAAMAKLAVLARALGTEM